MNAPIPAAMPASIESARSGLSAMSSRIVPPAGLDSYSEPANDEPTINSIGMAMISPTDQLPNAVFGLINFA